MESKSEQSVFKTDKQKRRFSDDPNEPAQKNSGLEPIWA